MKPLHKQTINEQSLMPKDWLQRRLTRFVHKGSTSHAFRPTVTLVDISKWFGVAYSYIRQMEEGRIAINDQWQIQLSQFFYLLDMGFIEIRVDRSNRCKTWVRVTPSATPCKVPMPRVNFSTAKLKFD